VKLHSFPAGGTRMLTRSAGAVVPSAIHQTCGAARFNSADSGERA